MKILLAFLLLSAALISMANAGQGFRPQPQFPTTPRGEPEPPPGPVLDLPFPPHPRRRMPSKGPERVETLPKPRPLDPTQARREAQELAELAQRIPAQIDQLSQNVLPKDLPEQLRRIEKLAKHLRKEISR